MITLITQKRHCCLNEIGISVSKFVCHHAEDHGPIIIETAGSFCSLIQTRLILVSGSISKGIIMETISKEQLTNIERGYINNCITKDNFQIKETTMSHQNQKDLNPISTQKKQSTNQLQNDK